MFKSILRNRVYLLTALLVVITFVICGVAWLRFFTVAVTNPSPVRYMSFEIEDQLRDPFPQDCVGPAFIELDAVWRYCQYTDVRLIDTDQAAQWGFVRFDLAEGVAALRWPLPITPDTQILAFAPNANDQIAVAWGTPTLSAIVILDRSGGTQSLSLPPAVEQVAGLAWTPDSTLELLAPTEAGDLAIFASSDADAGWENARSLAIPACQVDQVCAFQVARYDPTVGWEAIIATAAQQITDLAQATITFTTIDENMQMVRLGSATLAELAPAQYAVDDAGQLQRLGSLFDRSPGNVINWQMEAAPFMLNDAGAQQLMSPEEEASFYFSNYQIVDNHLSWIPGLRHPSFSWYMGDWMTLREGEDGLFLATYDGAAGNTLAGASFLKQGTQACILPASDGGYWVLGPYGAYVKASEEMSRADSLTIIERIERTFANFSRFDTVSDDFYREQRALKIAAFPLILLSLPVGYLLIFYVRRTRSNPRAWIPLLLQVSAVYLIVATLFFWWFWELMGDF